MSQTKSNCLFVFVMYYYGRTVKEVFVCYRSVERITGKSLADTILSWLDVVGLSPLDTRGQCYDGASNMCGARSGCSTLVRQQAPMATYVRCAAHRLNLAVVSACKIQVLKNAKKCALKILPGSLHSQLKGSISSTKQSIAFSQRQKCWSWRILVEHDGLTLFSWSYGLPFTPFFK